MPMAAVPKYLGSDFIHASPGMRFGMYLKLWGLDRDEFLWSKHDIEHGTKRDETPYQKKIENSLSALDDARTLTKNDKLILNALALRQKKTFECRSSNGFYFSGTAVAPFTTGLGNEHPLENGFAFLNPYGLPYLPGSGVKGVLRQAARELASGEWGDKHGWSENKEYGIVVDNQKIKLSMIDVLFGLESNDGDDEHVLAALNFWDVIPEIKGGKLAIEIMNPHHGHYYLEKRDSKSGNSISPHDSGQPVPIYFLTVPPGSIFNFYITCDQAHLKHLPLGLIGKDEVWKTRLNAVFDHAFQWLGFGAKTAVGYGIMQNEEQQEQEALRHQE